MAAPPPCAPAMFVVTEADAAAIRAAYQQRGEFAAAVELRRRFPGLADNELRSRRLLGAGNATTAVGEARASVCALPDQAVPDAEQRQRGICAASILIMQARD